MTEPKWITKYRASGEVDAYGTTYRVPSMIDLQWIQEPAYGLFLLGQDDSGYFAVDLTTPTRAAASLQEVSVVLPSDGGAGTITYSLGVRNPLPFLSADVGVPASSPSSDGTYKVSLVRASPSHWSLRADSSKPSSALSTGQPAWLEFSLSTSSPKSPWDRIQIEIRAGFTTNGRPDVNGRINLVKA
jgi:hypothetical protein